MHLEVLQSESVTEQNVTPETIEKLYNLAYSNPSLGISSKLDATSNLQGTVSLYATYQDYVNYLQNKFPNFHINTSTYYFRFTDQELTTICAQFFGDGIGVTTAELASISRFSDEFKNAISNNSSIRNLDLRGFTGITGSFTGGMFSNISNLENIYVKDVDNRVFIDVVSNSPKRTINKLIVDGTLLGTLNSDMEKQDHRVYALQGGTANSISYKIVAIRRIAPKVTMEFPNSYNSCFGIGDYITRGINIENFYLDEKNPERVILRQGYNDNINKVVNFYVPIGCAQAYANSTTWGQMRNSEFLEYDFDNDPNGIFI